MFKNTCKLQVGLALRGSKRGPSWAQVGVKLRSEAILEATWRRLGRRCRHDAVLGPSWRQLGGNLAELEPPRGPSWAPRGRELRRTGPDRRSARRPWTYKVRLLTDRSRSFTTFYHGRPRGGRIQFAHAHSAGLRLFDERVSLCIVHESAT